MKPSEPVCRELEITGNKAPGRYLTLHSYSAWMATVSRKCVFVMFGLVLAVVSGHQSSSDKRARGGKSSLVWVLPKKDDVTLALLFDASFTCNKMASGHSDPWSELDLLSQISKGINCWFEVKTLKTFNLESEIPRPSRDSSSLRFGHEKDRDSWPCVARVAALRVSQWCLAMLS